jgi:hypothetical protein
MQRIAALALAFSIGISTTAGTVSAQTAAPALKRADFLGETVSIDAQNVAEWVVHSGDHQGLPFIIVDKVYARALAFDASGRMIATTPVLIGMAVGDTFAPGVASMDMHQTLPSQRITPAGRFFAEEDRNLQGQRVLWVDYDTGIAIHKLSSKRTSQRRHERMASPYPADHRITFGCINVPPAFYEEVVARHFRRKGGIVYVLPDTAPLKTVFKSFDVIPQAQARADPTHFIPASARRF